MLQALPPSRSAEIREQILEAAYDLFTRQGIRGVAIDDVLERAGVTRGTLVEHFTSKDELALAVLAERERIWTFGFVAAEAQRRGESPRAQLLAIFDAFDEWFRRSDFEACTFITAVVEVGGKHPVGSAGKEHLHTIRGVIRGLAEEAGLSDVDAFAHSFHILMKGSIISAAEGDVDAAMRAREMAAQLIERHRGLEPAPLAAVDPRS